VVEVTNKLKDFVGQNKIHFFLLVPLLAYWLPILRFGFDSHHDGLIIASVTNLDFGDSSVPFNQYGPAWFILLKIACSLSTDSFLFLTLRLVTLLCYLVSFLATYFLARKFLSQRYSLSVVVILLGIQPFVTDFNSDMIPWPSALTMFLIPLVGMLIIGFDESNSSIKSYVMSLASGSLVLLAALTRVQIGLAMLLTILVLLIGYRSWKALAFFSVGFLASSIFAFVFLAQLGWVRDLTYDVIGFGSTYAFGDRATFPRPIWTFFLTFAFILLFLGLQRFDLPSTRFIYVSSVASATLFIVFGAYLILIGRQLNMIQTLTVLFRRIWISGLLAAAILGVLILSQKISRDRKLPEFKMSVLVALSFVAQLQIWPLFDQMHSWWGATPCVILAAVLLRSLKPLRTLAGRSKVAHEYALLSIVSLIAFTTFLSTISHNRVPLPINGFSGILISEQEGAELAEVNEYLQSQMNPNDEVLNLCTNANIFFDPEITPKSAARSFVFWTPMFDLSKLRNDILDSNPTKVVTCSFVTNPIFYPEYRAKQVEILEHFDLLTLKPSTFKSPKGVIWEVYSRGAQA